MKSASVPPPFPPAHVASPPKSAAPAPAHFSSSGSEMPVVINTPPPRMRESFTSSARQAAERVWSARLAWLQRARSVLPRAKTLGNQAAQLVPRAKALGARAARSLPSAKRALPSARRWVPKAARWTRRAVRSTPRAALVTAPFVALFAVWLVHGVLTRHQHAAHSVALVASPLAPVVVTHAATTQTAIAVALATPSPAPPSAPLSTALRAPTLTATAEPSALADDAELKLALSQGLPAMEGLAAKYTTDPQVLVALASSEAQAQRYEAAIENVDRALYAAPNHAQSGKIMGILWRAAQSPAAEEAFASLRKLGGSGSDVELDLATTPGVRDAVRERAKAELTNYLALDASPDTRAATALLLAPDCSTRKSLLERAARDGGKRTLAMLERFSRGAGCSSSSEGACNACLMGSSVLAQALAKLNAAVKP
ncbi:MAG TPA: hypothetical protein VK745_23995 [Polyangiaceae bacterium]|nr:hypothetical protein [Polyangiaceae bacterium]